MRFLLIAMMIAASTMAHAEVQQLPGANISAKVIGGTVLMINMKHSLVIDGDEQLALNIELGDSTRKAFFKDMILSKDVSYLKSTYGSKNHKITNMVISRYENLVSLKSKLSMNFN